MFSEERLKAVMGAILEIPPEGIGAGTSTDTVEGWDSLKHMRLIIALEEAFDVTIPDEEVATMTSYEIVKLVVAEQAGAAR
jgi:acyl carrier protein